MVLKKVWLSGQKPNFDNFQGNFKVEAMSGILLLIELAVKKWTIKIDGLAGYNIIDNKVRGYFGKYFVNDECQLDYSLSQNSKTWSRALNLVRELTPEVYIGKTYFLILNKYRFLGHFLLIKK